MPLNENAVRKETHCRGCGGAKPEGCVVCWNCFKYRSDVTPFKYFDGGLDEWLVSIGRGPQDSVAMGSFLLSMIGA